MDKTLNKNELLNHSKHFCMIPWTHMHMWPNGDTFYCCASDTRYPIGNFNNSSLEKLWNSPKMKEARLKLLNDQPLKACQRCYTLENDAKSHTLRRQANYTYGDKYWALVKSTNEDGTLEKLNMPYLDIRFSNICNLRCRSCGPELSSSWLKDEMKILGWKRLPNIIQVDEPTRLWRELKPLLTQVESVNFAGGEPLVDETHYHILDHWIEKQYSPITVCYTTNLTKLKFKKWNVLDLWKNFSNVLVVASLDASYKRAEYMRKGTVWQQITKNRLSIQNECPHVKFDISPTVSAFNVWHLPDFLSEWILENYLDPANIRINMLTHPQFMDARILPDSFLHKVCERYEHTLETLLSKVKLNEYQKQKLSGSFYSVINFIQTKKTLDKSFEKVGIQKFLSHTQILDSVREESFAETFPELSFLLTADFKADKWEALCRNQV